MKMTKNRIISVLLMLVFALGITMSTMMTSAEGTQKLKNEDINSRDSYILVHEGKYYLYGTRGEAPFGNSMDGFDVYVGDDLENWEGPYEIFHNNGDFWATKNYWAPECYYINNSFYFITTFGSDDRNKGIQILKSDSPLGPFEPISDGPITPPEVDAIDATLFVEDGITYMLYSHNNTGIYAVALTNDLTEYNGEPFKLFSADDAPWVRTGPFGDGYLTDGPCPYVTKSGKLIMLWSSFDSNGYNVGMAYSDNGKLAGNWTHEEETFLDGNCGHCMIFSNLEGELMLALHSPNGNPAHPTFLYIKEENDTLVLGKEDNTDAIKVSEIKLSRQNASMLLNGTLNLTASVLPSNASNNAVVWTSTNDKIAAVDQTGKVTAKGIGRVTIKATAKDGTNVSGSCVVTVTHANASKVAVTAVGLASNQKAANLYLVKGGKVSIKGTVTPANAKQEVKYTSKKNAIASVNAKGVIKGKKVGNTTITVKSADGKKSTNVKVHVVKKAKTVTNLKVARKKMTVNVKKTAQIKTTVKPATTTYKVTYRVKNSSIATVSKTGVITGKKKGSTKITVKCGKKKQLIDVNIK